MISLFSGGNDEDQTTVSTKLPAPAACNKRLIGYYEHEDELKRSQIEPLTHLIFNFFAKTVNHLEQPHKVFRNWRNFEKTRKMARKNNPKLKIMFVLYEADEEEIQKLSESKNDEGQPAFDIIANFMSKHDFDGVEVRWDQKEVNIPQQLEYLKSLQETFMDRESGGTPYVISLNIPQNGEYFEKINFDKYMNYVDFITVDITQYEYVVPGPYYIAPAAPLYTGPGVLEKWNVNWTMSYLICKTEQPEIFNFAVTFEGILWKHLEDFNSIENASTPAKNTKWQYNGRTIYKGIKHHGFDMTTTQWEPKSRTPYIWNKSSKEILRFENEQSLREKMMYLLEHNIGGIALVNLDYDDEKGTLFNSVAQSKWCDDEKEKKVQFDCDNWNFHPLKKHFLN